MNCFIFSDLKEGLEQSFNILITQEKMNMFSLLSEDMNPMHIDSTYARSKGFENRVVYGMLTACFYSTLVGMYLPGKFCLLQGIDIKFIKPVYVGDSLTITGRINYINQSYKQIELKAIIVNQAGIKVSVANIKSGVIDE